MRRTLVGVETSGETLRMDAHATRHGTLRQEAHASRCGTLRLEAHAIRLSTMAEAAAAGSSAAVTARPTTRRSAPAVRASRGEATRA